MHLDDALDDREAEAGTTLFPGDGTVSLLKRLEDLLLIGFRDTWAGVRHGHCEGAGRGRRPRLHLAGLGELDGIADEVQEYLRQAPLVTLAGWGIGRQRDRDRQPFLHRQGFHGAEDRLHHLGEGVVAERQGGCPPPSWKYRGHR